MVTMCVGGGVGAAGVYENLNWIPLGALCGYKSCYHQGHEGSLRATAISLSGAGETRLAASLGEGNFQSRHGPARVLGYLRVWIFA
jgi:hypothetical protein